jgi:leader peptidase (prepilin peptidase)/N-methyltransferase
MEFNLLYFWLLLAFLLGISVGSYLNVCIHRIPYEKSLLWPRSRCACCFQKIAWYDNIPLLSYWLLRGRCRTCGARFSIRYFLIELFTGLAFAGIFYLDVVLNVCNLPSLDNKAIVELGFLPLSGGLLWLHHVLLFSLLLVTSLCDLDHMEIPLPVTIAGTVVGLSLATLFPWPYPEELRSVGPRVPQPGLFVPPSPLTPGIYPWPVWYPLPDWLPPGSWRLGLATGLAGALAGMVILRGVRFLFGVGRGVEGLGIGDADLMMMAGAFLGWQPVVLAFFVSVFPALLFGIGQMIFRGNQLLPFGPSLALGVLITAFTWPRFGAKFRQLFFDSTLMLTLFIAGAVFMLITSFLLRLLRGAPPPAETATKE